MHAVFADGLTVIRWNTQATFTVNHAGRDVHAWTNYSVQTLEQAQGAAAQWWHDGGKEEALLAYKNL